jgi:hypothetical protein
MLNQYREWCFHEIGDNPKSRWVVQTEAYRMNRFKESKMNYAERSARQAERNFFKFATDFASI